ncbi:hypothetical protein TR51_19070 [Kitasatospora griseola]|uniref:Uncharacterized protein n=1 Tax=Kitasatospora griseola TaxID=2064 RepID=A0A0D0PNZ5_KITGR|nr:hypothetical protein [Kitasatospora griseola]KIQ64254.1 hypothetical protein TR51_19070 [Kitasatospora griseola]
MTTRQHTYKPSTANWCADWYCGACGSTGEARVEDGIIVDASHDCEEGGGGQIGWDGRAECGECGWTLDVDFADGDHVEADHDCDTDQ